MASPSSNLLWSCRDRTVELGSRTQVMGILNCTPDSFSDGGLYADTDSAVEQGLRMVADGADLIDVGGESTRPGSASVPVDEELARVVPVIEELRRQTDVLISVDTRKSPVARAACNAGADIINDVSAGTDDPELPQVARQFSTGLILMHMLESPATMQNQPTYDRVVEDIRAYLAERLAALEADGLSARQLVCDPGIGFGKTLEHNLDLLAGLPRLRSLGRPLLLGVSRKSFLHALTQRPVEDRLAGSIAANTICILQGADILRVHDVKETCDLVAIADMFTRRWDTSSN